MTRQGSSSSTRLRRYQRIVKRQSQNRWGADYTPSIKAIRSEAPGVSRPSILSPPNKLGRPLHALSLPERSFILLALYCPQVFDLHEQRMMSTGPAPHPLDGHPKYEAAYPAFLGTLAAVEKLGLLGQHARLRYESRTGDVLNVPDVYVSDLLLFIRSDSGPYCVNWDIKKTRADFDRVFDENQHNRSVDRSAGKAWFRHHMEQLYYRECGIPTYTVAADALCPTFIAGLERAYSVSGRPHSESKKTCDLIVSTLQLGLETGDSPLAVERYFLAKQGVTSSDFRTVMYTAIWNRQLRVDLHQPVLHDRPLRPERTDPLVVHSDWFAQS